MKNKFLTIAAVCAVLSILSGFSQAQIKKCTEHGAITSVVKSRSGNFEFVTFEVLSDSPDYKVTDAKAPFTDYSGETRLRIKGKYFKRIALKGITWDCEITEKFSAKTSTIMGIKNVEQFEGYVTYVIGYRTKAKYVSTEVTGTGSSRKIILKFRK